MSRVFTSEEPVDFFQYFEKIASIPRGSYHEKEISDYFKTFAQEHGLEVMQDSLYNIFIKKPASPGYENAQPVIFHGHMDMILAKNPGVGQDMLEEGIRLIKEGEYVYGDGTTLGADNGVGLSFILCVLANKAAQHPPLEVVITVQEEVGKVGLSAFDKSVLTGKRLIDFNWRSSDSIYAACAGDISVKFRIPKETGRVPDGYQFGRLVFDGFTGGHSEHEIVLQRANAIVAFARTINAISQKMDIMISEPNMGVNRYAIPNHADICIAFPGDRADELMDLVRIVKTELRHEFELTDPDLNIAFSKFLNRPEATFLSSETTRTLVKCVGILPNGVQSVCLDRAPLPQSSNCIAMVASERETVDILSTIPSAISSIKYAIVQKMKDLADFAGAKVECFADCPEWPFNPKSKLLETAKQAFRDVNGKEPGVVVAHSSLEVGLFRLHIPELDAISVGGESSGYHTTSERFHYTTAKPTLAFIYQILKLLKN